MADEMPGWAVLLSERVKALEVKMNAMTKLGYATVVTLLAILATLLTGAKVI